MPGVAMDTGPPVAYFCAREARHALGRAAISTISGAAYYLRAGAHRSSVSAVSTGVPAWRLLEKLAQGVFRIGLHLEGEAGALQALMNRYRNVPMALADACLVRLAELHALPVRTLDADFTIYRIGRSPLSLVTPRS